MSTEPDLLDDKTIGVGIGIDDGRSQFLLSPKRKLAETGDGGSLPLPAEKRNRVDETEEQKPPLGKQQGGGCQCKGGEHEMEECECESESEAEGESEVMVLPDYMVEYYKKISAILGVEIGVGTLGGCDGDEYMDEDDEQIGNMSTLLTAYPELLEKCSGTDPLLCCDNPFNDLDFKQDSTLYDALKAFGEKVVKDLSARYKDYDGPCFQDVERVESCPASCNHRVVTLKAINRSGQVLQIMLQGQLPLGHFAEAKPNEFVLLKYGTVR